jgi:hypothetical protein
VVRVQVGEQNRVNGRHVSSCDGVKDVTGIGPGVHHQGVRPITDKNRIALAHVEHGDRRT